jgi:hypothetical protein
MNFTYQTGDIRTPLLADVDVMAKAATSAMAQTAEAAKNAVRADLAGAGFSAKWLNATRSKVYPEGGASLSPAALIYNRISYSEIFETGGQINGHPLLWLPIEANTGGKVRPRDYGGTLVSVNIPGRPPLLFDKDRRVPVFVGVSQVTLRKRLNADAAVAREAGRLPERYEAAIKAAG